MHTLSDSVLIHRMKPDGTNFTATAAATDATSDFIDMLGFEGVAFVIGFGAIVSGAATSFKLQHSDVSGSGYADVASTSQTVGDTSDNGQWISEVYRPTKRYLRVVTSRATQNSTIDYLLALRYLPHHAAVTQSATTIGREQFNAPISGTA